MSSHSRELVPWERTTKLEFPRFNGEGLEGWLLRAEYFFEVGNIAHVNRVKVATLRLMGRAIPWHQGYIKIKGSLAYTNWEEYVKALGARLSTNAYEDPLAELRNLKQDGSLQEYFNSFDELY